MNAAQSFEPDTIINPFYAVTFAESLFSSPEPRVSREDWILLNANTIEDIGAAEWLKEFLLAISQSDSEYDGHEIINPTLTVSLSPGLKGSHKSLINKSDWVTSNVKMIHELGVNAWLELLLKVLSK